MKGLTIELPTQMPMVSSILFFIAIHTEVTCSAAFACGWTMFRQYSKEHR